ncbi:MAG: hemolysin family protein [Alphaproteobacteria bacterium]
MAEMTWPAGSERANTVKDESDEPSSDGGILTRLQSMLRLSGRNNGPGGQVEELIGRELEHSKEFSRQEMLMLSRLLAFRHRRVEDAMVPRADIIAVEASSSLSDLVCAFSDAAHSRLPVFRETLDDPVGMVHIKDILPVIAASNAGTPSGGAESGEFSLSRIVREVLFVPPSMPAADLLVKMQTTRVHMALVIDEYGGTDGLVTIEDLVELIVGDIEDEHDVEESPEIIPCDDGSYIADARAELGDLMAKAGVEFVPERGDNDIDTLGGLVFSLVGRVPQRGEIVSDSGVEFEVMDADPRRIKRMRIRRRKGATEVNRPGGPQGASQAEAPETGARGDRETS